MQANFRPSGLAFLPMKHLFTQHPNEVGETYAEHFVVATGFGSRMILAGFACLLHGLFPFLFVKTGSNAIRELHERMVTHRRVKPLPEGAPRSA
ncbi:MAG: hypothetical protein OHK0024_20090 [Thalassobaculales bacterium]